MRKQYELTGQVFGRLTVVERDREQKGKPWICRCDCGNEKRVSTHHLMSGAVKSCGCLRSDQRVKDLTGQRFGRLVAEQRVRNGERGSSFWKCRCDCGRSCEASSGNLKSGQTKSCGCLQAEVRRNAWTKAREARMALYIEGTDVCQMKQKPRRNNTSGVVGVTYDRSVGVWKASMEFRKKRYYLGASKEMGEVVGLRKETEQILKKINIIYEEGKMFFVNTKE